MEQKIKTIRLSLKEVFTKPSYILVALIAGFVIFALAVLLPNLAFLSATFTSSTFTLATKLKLFWTSLGAFETNLTFAAQITTAIIAPLAGINIAMLIYYFRKRAAGLKTAGTSVLGIIGSFLGIGCASCGSVILSSLIGIGATAGLVTFLPLHGAEFGILGIVVVAWSTFVVAKKIQAPLVCEV